MEGLINKSTIGINREIVVGLHTSKRLLVLCRYFTEEELEQKTSRFAFAAICIDIDIVNKIIAEKAKIEQKLEELAIGLPIGNEKIALGQDIYLTLDSETSTAQVRRFWHSPTGLAPTRTGVSLSASEMMNFLAECVSLAKDMIKDS